MVWIWQRKQWPNFTFDNSRLEKYEQQFLKESGYFLGAFDHSLKHEQEYLRVELITAEAEKTSFIEGEVLNRSSVQASIQQNLGIRQYSNVKINKKESGIATLLTDLHQNFDEELSADMLFSWHRKLLEFNDQLSTLGSYRTSLDPMRIVSGAVYDPKVHYEAPPSAKVREEMERFVHWFNQSHPNKPGYLPPLTRAGIAHIYFEWIHPFEDGNGRIGRAIVEKALSQELGRPSLISLSAVIQDHRGEYYRSLNNAGSTLDLTGWLTWFSEIIIKAQVYSNSWIVFTINKGKLLKELLSQLNERQIKVLNKLAEAGPRGFVGGLSSKNYQSITGTSTATATRDLNDLVEKGALIKKGQKKYTRYYFPF